MTRLVLWGYNVDVASALLLELLHKNYNRSHKPIQHYQMCEVPSSHTHQRGIP